MALENRTPAELAGIKDQGKNKWLTLIQIANAKYPVKSMNNAKAIG
jgi:hypothetical protein